MASIFAGLSFAITVAAYYPYIRSILRGETRPRKVTWFIWGLVDAIIFFAMLSKGELALQMAAYVVGATVIFTLSFWKGERGWTLEDKIVLAGAAVAMAFWFILDATAGIMVSLLASTIGSLPTYRSVWRDRRAEPFWPWLMYGVGGFFAVLAITDWSSPAAYLGPVWFFGCQLVMIALFLPVRPARTA